MPKSDEHEADNGAKETYGQDDADVMTSYAGSCLVGFQLRGNFLFPGCSWFLLFAIQMMETFRTQMVRTEVGFKAGPSSLTQITLLQMRGEILGLQGFAGGGAHELRR